MPGEPTWGNFVLSSLLQELIVTMVGIALAYLIHHTWIQWRYGGWVVIISKKEVEPVRRSVSARKTRIVLDEEADLSVFLKGIVSPYAKITIDLIGEESKRRGLLVVDREKRQFVINLDQNPPPLPVPVAENSVSFVDATL